MSQHAPNASHVEGPGAPYSVLFDDDTGVGPGLPAPFRAVYGGDWRLPAAPDTRPYTYTNFVVSHDGRISFDEPGRSGGNAVSRDAKHDTWLMALLRSRADAILTGGGTLRVARNHRWMPWETYPADEAAFVALRHAEQRPLLPLLVVVTGSGNIPVNAAALHVEGRQVVVATTGVGEQRLRKSFENLAHLRFHISPGEHVDFARLLQTLRAEYKVDSLLSEGGARIYGELIAAKLIDEVYTTVSPIVIGNRQPPAEPRPALVEGVAFSPHEPPRLQLVSLRRHDDYLFQRARFARDAKP